MLHSFLGRIRIRTSIGHSLSGAMLMLLFVQSGDAADLDAMLAPSPERPWTVPHTGSYSAITSGEHPDSAATPMIDPDKAYELAELIDIAQRTNPETRVAWERARQAALGI